MNVNTPAVAARGARPGRNIILGALLLMVSWMLQAVAGLMLMDYEDLHFQGWNWDGISHWLSSKSAGFQAAFWGSAVGSQVGFLAGAFLIGLGLFHFFKGRRKA
jgi:hypothetical protein